MDILEILDRQEELISKDVEQVFRELESIPKKDDWKRYTTEAQQEIKYNAVQKALKDLRQIRNNYITECEKAIENYEITQTAPQIADSYSLMTNKYKLMSKPLESQLEALRGTTNQNDFEIMKGMILERLTDQDQIRQVMKIQIPTEETLKRQAIGQLKFRTANIDYIPALPLHRAVAIQGQGLSNYLNTLL